MGLPFSEIVTPPAMPGRSVTFFTPSTLRALCGSMVAEKTYLPSARASTHTASSAVISPCTVAAGFGGVTLAGAGFVSAGFCPNACAGAPAGWAADDAGGAVTIGGGAGWAAAGADGGAPCVGFGAVAFWVGYCAAFWTALCV